MQTSLRKLLLILLLLISTCFAAIPALVPGQQNTGTTGTTPGTCAYPGSTTSSNTLFLLLSASHGNAVTSITGGGATWVKIVSSDVNFDSEIWTAPNTSGSSTPLTINFTGSGNIWFNCTEWSGMPTTTVNDQSASNNGTSTTPTTATITNTNGNDLILATAIVVGTFSSGPTNSFTALSTPDNTRFLGAYQVVSSTGSYSTGWVFNFSGWDAQIASFQGAAAAAAGGAKILGNAKILGTATVK